MEHDQPAPPKKQRAGNKNLKPFKKGQSGNPGGRPKDSEQVKAFKRLTSNELAEVGTKVMKCNKNELMALAKDDTISVLQVAVAAVMVRAINKGDMQSLDLLLNRVIGKVKDHHDFSGIPVAPAAQVVISLPGNGREKK